MKVIAVDNFDRDWVSQRLIAESLDQQVAEMIVQVLNDAHPEPCTEWYYMAKPENYVLKEWEP
jgi:hypothetical protein